MGDAVLLLSDGTVFRGRGFGYTRALDERSAAGELVFNTSMSGYQEIMTDPSYTGQIVVFTTAHLGNYGCEEGFTETGTGTEGRERLRPKCGAVVTRNLYGGAVPEGRMSLDAWMKDHRVAGICGVDTRALTLHLRDRGSMNGMICRSEAELEAVRGIPSMEGLPLARQTGNGIMPEGGEEREGGAAPRVVLVDYGVKAGILRELRRCGADIRIVPASASAGEILDQGPDGVLLSNGPGDPAVLEREIAAVADLKERVPLFGICLGHQLLALALGGRTRKMAFGHHGGNHPVREISSGRVYVTSQNHGFEVDPAHLPEETEVSWRNLNDGSVEGIRHLRLPLSSVQFHPEASPGPREAAVIIDRWVASLPRKKERRN